jgi:hypothetical protein
VNTYNHHSARARTQHAGGMLIADYSGFFVPQAWASLGMQIAQERKSACVGVDRYYRAAHSSVERLDGISFDYLAGSPPGAWIVRPDQYATALHVSRRLADMGVVRTVFLQALESLALDFARAQCLVSCQ